MELKANETYMETTIELLVTPPKLAENGANDLLSTKEAKENDIVDDDVSPPPPFSLCFLYRSIYHLRRLIGQYSQLVKIGFRVLLFLAYMGYFTYCMYYRFGDEPSVRLLWVTIIGLLCIVTAFIKRHWLTSLTHFFHKGSNQWIRAKKVIRWGLYLLSAGGAVTIVAVDVVPQRPQNLICLAGIAALILLCVLISRRPEQINWHAIFWGLGLQFWFAVLIWKTWLGRATFQWLAERSEEFFQFSDEGAKVTFGQTFRDHKIVFQIMPSIIFLNSVICVLYHLGVAQVIFAEFGRFLSLCIGTSPVESVTTTANLFLSMMETPSLIRPFLKDMTQAELFAIITAGFASVSGSVFFALAALGAPIQHILAASMMSAPAALAFAKLIYPDERKPTIKAEDVYRVDVGQFGSILNALSTGAKDGLKMAGLALVNLMIYISVLRFTDSVFLWFSLRAGVNDFTLTKLCSYLLYPVTYLMGFEVQDCLKAGRLLGVKLLTMSFLSFMELGILVKNGHQLEEYVSTYNDTWTYVGDDIFLQHTNTTLVGGVMTERSAVLATYMNCGFSNLVSIGITVGAYSAVAPYRARDVLKLASLGCLAGNLACISTACIAGLLYTD